jgi:DNA mismatch repair protein MutS
VVERAKVVLEALEKGDRERPGQRALIDDLPLFRAAKAEPPARVVASAVEARLREINPDELSAREALQLIYELRGLVK